MKTDTKTQTMLRRYIIVYGDGTDRLVGSDPLPWELDAPFSHSEGNLLPAAADAIRQLLDSVCLAPPGDPPASFRAETIAACADLMEGMPPSQLSTLKINEWQDPAPVRNAKIRAYCEVIAKIGVPARFAFKGDLEHVLAQVGGTIDISEVQVALALARAIDAINHVNVLSLMLRRGWVPVREVSMGGSGDRSPTLVLLERHAPADSQVGS
jgi:hypothetical protein